VDFLVMEYVTGKTLQELIQRGGMPLKEALRIATQVAEGLAKAHAAGLVHRDIKPGNVMVPENGPVKILDFGLAKRADSGKPTENETTRTLGPVTEEGVALGTVSFMSPEQAQGKPVDGRSDIFSFGSMLYEMLTGRRAFQEGSTVGTLAAILHRDPLPIASSGVPRSKRMTNKISVVVISRNEGKEGRWRISMRPCPRARRFW
jgi:serine/threonine protein kinase